MRVSERMPSRTTPDTAVVRASGGMELLQVEAVQFHDLDPRCSEVLHELRLRVVAGLHLGNGSQLGVRAEEQVDARTGDGGRAGGVVAALVGVLARIKSGPLRSGVKQRHKEVIAEYARPVREDAIVRLVVVRAEHAAHQ